MCRLYGWIQSRPRCLFLLRFGLFHVHGRVRQSRTVALRCVQLHGRRTSRHRFADAASVLVRRVCTVTQLVILSQMRYNVALTRCVCSTLSCLFIDLFVRPHAVFSCASLPFRFTGSGCTLRTQSHTRWKPSWPLSFIAPASTARLSPTSIQTQRFRLQSIVINMCQTSLVCCTKTVGETLAFSPFTR
jgi:hypothetical protein